MPPLLRAMMAKLAMPNTKADVGSGVKWPNRNPFKASWRPLTSLVKTMNDEPQATSSREAEPAPPYRLGGIRKK